MGARTSKVLQSPESVPYTDSSMIGKNFNKERDRICAIYAKKTVRFVAVNARDPYVPKQGKTGRITVLYNSVHHKIEEILHE